jgi:hypothetical protein
MPATTMSSATPDADRPLPCPPAGEASSWPGERAGGRPRGPNTADRSEPC